MYNCFSLISGGTLTFVDKLNCGNNKINSSFQDCLFMYCLLINNILLLPAYSDTTLSLSIR